MPTPSRTTPCPFQGTICDSRYNAKALLWTLEDWRAAHQPKKDNSARPPMEKVLVFPDTLKVVDRGTWTAIYSTAKNLFRDMLSGLPVPAGIVSGTGKGAVGTKTYYETHHSKAWAAAIHALEEAAPVLTWCAANWKATAIMSSVAQQHKRPKGKPGMSAPRSTVAASTSKDTDTTADLGEQTTLVSEADGMDTGSGSGEISGGKRGRKDTVTESGQDKDLTPPGKRQRTGI